MWWLTPNMWLKQMHWNGAYFSIFLTYLILSHHFLFLFHWHTLHCSLYFYMHILSWPSLCFDNNQCTTLKAIILPSWKSIVMADPTRCIEMVHTCLSSWHSSFSHTSFSFSFVDTHCASHYIKLYAYVVLTFSLLSKEHTKTPPTTIYVIPLQCYALHFPLHILLHILYSPFSRLSDLSFLYMLSILFFTWHYCPFIVFIFSKKDLAKTPSSCFTISDLSFLYSFYALHSCQR